MKVSPKALAELYNVDRRTVTNWVNEDPPCPSDMEGRDRVFITQDVARWLEDRAVRKALEKKEKQEPQDTKKITERREFAQMRLAEIELEVREGSLIATDVHKEVVGEVCDRLRAVLINLPSNHTLTLERLGVSAQAAQEVLEAMADDLTRATRQVGDDMEVDDRASD